MPVFNTIDAIKTSNIKGVKLLSNISKKIRKNNTKRRSKLCTEKFLGKIVLCSYQEKHEAQLRQIYKSTFVKNTEENKESYVKYSYFSQI